MYLLEAGWLSLTIMVTLIGSLTLFCSRVPHFLKLISTYGKSQTKGQNSIPKKWFYHFYVFATCFYTYLGYATLSVHVNKQSVPLLIQLLRNNFVGHTYCSTVGSASAAVAMGLLLVQVFRRLYECTLLSIYDEEGRMSLAHYMLGYLFYFGVGLSLMAEINGFNVSCSSPFKLEELYRVNHVIGVLLFSFSTVIQYKSNKILACLRQDFAGRVVTYKHSIPKGGLFELVSCPHYLAEILIYFSINIVFSFESCTWWLLCSFVLINQVFLAIFNHIWYLENFHDYPIQRKAIIPFLL